MKDKVPIIGLEESQSRTRGRRQNERNQSACEDVML